MTTYSVKNGWQSRVSEPSPSPSRSRVLSEHETEKGSNNIEEGEFFQEVETLPRHSSTAVPWEQFLSRRHLRVLLVENDNCTCHVVTALLRNCSYQVISACNGLEAWKRMNDTTSQFDLVLTEVDMPSLSGIGLLCQIMAHKAYKHIPVIMMSAQDSVGIVFKCLSKGAVDFLVKPVRKNELKNLWQHVWRRCNSSNVSGSGSISETENVPQPKSDSVASKNNTGSKDESDVSLNIMDSSENGSGTQSSWTKRAVEIESPREKLIGSHLEEPQRNQASGSVVIAEGRAIQREIDTDMSQDLDIVKRKAAHCELRNAKDKMSPETTACVLKHKISSTGYEDPVHTIGSRGHSVMAINLTCSVACKNKETDEENGDSGFKIVKNKEIHKEKVGSGCNFSSLLLELSCAKHLEGEVQERKILRQSGSSAFSRYNASSNFSLSLSGACSNSICPLPVGYGVGGSSAEVTACTQSSGHDNGPALYSQPFKRSNAEPMEVNAMPGSVTLKDQVLRMSPGHAMPMPFTLHPHGVLPYDGASGQYLPLFFSHPWASSSSPTHPQPHHSPHHHNQSKSSDGSKLQKDEQTMRDIGGNGPQWGSSNITNGLKFNNGQMGSSNGCAWLGHGDDSATGSNRGSIGNDGHNGHSNGQNHLISSTISRIADNNENVNVGAPLGNTVTVGGNVGAEQSQVAIGEATLNVGAEQSQVAIRAAALNVGAEQSQVAIREAALIKFRQKRKNRCYEKKVRYQSRKKLAEERPRVRGQFVRQNVYTCEQD